MKTQKFPVLVTEEGVSAKIRKFTRIKKGKSYTSFAAEYFLLGKRKQEWRSKFEDAEVAAIDACRKISRGQQVALPLVNGDRMEYLRATEALSRIGIKLDVAAHEYVSAATILEGRATITEACREWVKLHATEIPHVTVGKAISEIIQQANADKKSDWRLKQIIGVLAHFSNGFNVNVQEVTPSLVSQYLARLPFAERTKRNHRDVIGFFNRFCVLRGYLKRGTDWLEGVQNYSARKLGEISIYTPEEIKSLLANADKRFIPFLAIGSFAGLRHAEIARLDWSEIELSDRKGESFIEVRAENAKTEMRRLVPVSDNLREWLKPHQKTSGKVCQFANPTKQLLQTANKAGMVWKHNALRHSCISYLIAASNDVPRVSDQSGNSVTVIRSNYLRRVKPAVASEWFAIMPPRKPATRKLAV